MKKEIETNYVNETSYEIKLGTYDDYIQRKGLKYAKTPAAIELKEGTAKLYMLFKGGKYEDDFLIYPNEDNLASITNSRIIYGGLDYVLNYLKEEYEYITIIVQDEKRENIIREHCNIVKETVLEQTGWDSTIWKFKKFKVQLKDK